MTTLGADCFGLKVTGVRLVSPLSALKWSMEKSASTDMLNVCLIMFCPLGRFVPLDALSLEAICLRGCFLPLDVLSQECFVRGRLVSGCYVSGRFVYEPLK